MTLGGRAAVQVQGIVRAELEQELGELDGVHRRPEPVGELDAVSPALNVHGARLRADRPTGTWQEQAAASGP